MGDEKVLREFGTGATRNVDSSKLDYHGFLSPLVLCRYAKYMHGHRKQKDGSMRGSDNWKRGIPQEVYMKSLIRHTVDLWRLDSGETVVDPDSGEAVGSEDLLSAILFNAMGLLHEKLKEENRA